jgi:very-short-patch-repair endonuclease
MTKERPFHINATPIVFEYANALKKEMTEAEMILWKKLRGRRLKDLKFRRQHPVGKFILDFYCHALKLAVEVDGNIHELEDVEERDAGRTYMLTEWGITVIRFTNEEVTNNIDFVLNTIRSITNK